MNGFFRRLFRKTHTKLVSPDSSSPSETSVSDWPAFLNSYNSDLLAAPEVQEEAPREAVLQGWLGFPGADEEQILAAEGRIGITFPPSYRAFLKASNGWRGAGYYSNGVFPFELLPVEKIDWFRVNNQEWIDILMEYRYDIPDEEYYHYGPDGGDGVRAGYLQNAIEISSLHDAGVYLLLPDVAFPDGEWEAYHLASWIPGAYRYTSFAHLMQGERKRFHELHKYFGNCSTGG
jgi:hypothetical protein